MIKNRQLNAAVNLLNFARNCVAKCGGSGYLDAKGELIIDRGVETWITARMLYSFSLGKILLDNRLVDERQYKFDVEHVIEGLLQAFEPGGCLCDDVNDGWYAKVSSVGEVLDQSKAAYAHAFVILASATLLKAAESNDELAARAQNLFRHSFDIFYKYFWDNEQQMARDNYKHANWTALDDYRGINANMHTVEALTAASSICKELNYEFDNPQKVVLEADLPYELDAKSAYSVLLFDMAGSIIGRVVRLAKQFDYRIPEHFDEKWTPLPEFNSAVPDDPFKPFGATPGHAIEWGRLILQYNTVAKDDELAKVGWKLIAQTLSENYTRGDDEGIAYTTDFSGVPVVKTRMHWVVAEALSATAVLAKAGDATAWEFYAMLEHYAQECFYDEEYGSWFHELDDKNRLSDKVWPGKPDVYHVLQSYLIPLFDPGMSLATSIKPTAVVVVGELLFDIDHTKGSGLKALGGSLTNMAIGISRLGNNVKLYTGVGDDSLGTEARNILRSEHVDFDATMTLIAKTNTAKVTLDASGNAQYEFEYDPTIRGILTSAAADLMSAKALVLGSLSSQFPQGVAAHEIGVLAQEAKTRGVKVYYDPNIRPTVIPDRHATLKIVENYIAKSAVVKASLEDLEWLYGKQGEAFTRADCATWAERWLDLGAKLAVFTLGAEGAVGYFKEVQTASSGINLQSVYVRPNEVDVADTIGAGDSFMSALVDATASLDLDALNARTVEEVLHFASSVSAVTVSRKGSNPPHLHEL
ncbi:MAG: PfkB family carbohydrate kinase [Candidatus Ancillula sp.]|nr:PfkB family carbohydrate kinase [Candidatus Ancillula sp.]